MKRFFEVVPLSTCGITLAIASLGNLLSVVSDKILHIPGFGSDLSFLCLLITTFLLILLMLKFIICSKQVDMMLENAEMYGIFSAYSLTIMIWAGYLPEFTGDSIAQIVWWIGVVIHYTGMVIFTYRYVRHFKLPTLLPPWYIVYVGFAISGFSAQNFAPPFFGRVSFVFGFFSFWLIFFLLIKRSRISKIPRMDEPTLCITAAIGICLTTYVRNFTHPWPLLIIFMYLVSLIIWIWIMIHLRSWLKLPFYPTDAAFSFPFVVAAIASLEAMNSLETLGFHTQAFNIPIILVQTVVAVFMVILTTIRFAKFIIRSILADSHEQVVKESNQMDMSRNMDMSEGMKMNMTD